MLNVSLNTIAPLGRSIPVGDKTPKHPIEGGLALQAMPVDSFAVKAFPTAGLRALERVRFGTAEGFSYIKRQNIVNQLKHRAWAFPQGTALKIASPFLAEGQSATIKNWDLYTDVRRMTRVLKEKYNIKPGDRIAAVESNTPEFITLFYATLAAGATLAAVNVAAMADQPESLIHMLKVSNAKMLFVGNDKAFERVQKLQQLEPLLKPNTRKLIQSVPNWVYNLTPSWMPVLGKLKKGHETLQNPDIAKVITALPANLKVVLPKDKVFTDLGATEPLAETEMQLTPNPDQDALVLFTSGTESLPKAVPISHKALIHNTVFLKERAKEALMRNANLMMALPLFHIFGMAVFQVGMTSNTPITLIPSLKEAVTNIPKLLDSIEKEKPTVFPIIPGILKKMQAVPGAMDKMKSLKYIITGGDKLNKDLHDAVLQGVPGLKIWEGYGMTEVGILTLNTSGTYGNVGQPISPHIKVELRRSLEDGLPSSIEEEKIPAGGEGEIWVHTPSRGRTYEGAPAEKIDEMFKKDGWAKTGDIGTLSPENAIAITGRSKDTYKRNGEYTPMSRVNAYLQQLPTVKGAFSFPYKLSGEHEEKIVSMVVLKPGQSAKASELRSQLLALVAKGEMAPRFLSHLTMVLPGEDFPATFMGTDGKMKTKNARALLDKLLQQGEAIINDNQIVLVGPELLVSDLKS